MLKRNNRGWGKVVFVAGFFVVLLALQRYFYHQDNVITDQRYDSLTERIESLDGAYLTLQDTLNLYRVVTDSLDKKIVEDNKLIVSLKEEAKVVLEKVDSLTPSESYTALQKKYRDSDTIKSYGFSQGQVKRIHHDVVELEVIKPIVANLDSLNKNQRAAIASRDVEIDFLLKQTEILQSKNAVQEEKTRIAENTAIKNQKKAMLWKRVAEFGIPATVVITIILL